MLILKFYFYVFIIIYTNGYDEIDDISIVSLLR